MISISDAVLTEVNVAEITSNEFFNISKRNYPDNLIASIKFSGMLEVPYLIKAGSVFSILTCHNRIKVLRDTGISVLKCFVLEEPDVRIFMKNVSLKAYRNEIGPIGKIKTLFLLKTFFNLNNADMKSFCLKILKLPFEIIENEVYLNNVIGFPDSLINYIDEKDMSFKIIKDLSILPSSWIEIINKWLNNIQIRVNFFRMLVDFVFDIYRRGDNISVIDSIELIDDKNLYDTVYQIRYPEFFRLKMKAESIISELSGGGLTIDYPEYFDRSIVTIKLDIAKNSDCNDQLKKISDINIDKLKELLTFL